MARRKPILTLDGKQAFAFTSSMADWPHGAGVYAIRNKNKDDRVYVGSAICFRDRWHTHRKALRSSTHGNERLLYSFQKHGEDAFEFIVLEVVLLKEDCVPREQAWMDALKPWYNLSPTAGSCLGIKHSAETRARMSEERKRRCASPEYRAKMSAAAMGRVFSDESRAKLSAALKGKKRTPEQCERNSLAHKGRKMSEEFKRKCSERMKKFKHTAESKAKIAASNRRRKYSPETLKKMSEVQKGRKRDVELTRKASATHKKLNRHTTPENKKIISEAIKKYWAEFRAKRQAKEQQANGQGHCQAQRDDNPQAAAGLSGAIP